MSLEYFGVLVGAANRRCFRVWVTKTDKNTASVFRVFDLLYIQIKPYESELSTALSECKAVAQCATRKTNTAINRIKTVGACKNCGHHSENTYGYKIVGVWFMSIFNS